MKIQKKNYPLIALIACLVFLFGYVVCLNCKLIHTNNRLGKINESLQSELSESRKIYIYNVDKLLVATDMLKMKKQYKQDIINLNRELTEAENKIKSLKNAKVKEDFSEMYFKNLKMKRDEIVGNYEKYVLEATNKLNKALEDVIKEKNIPVVFAQKAVAVKTPNTIDITEDILAKLKQ